MVVLENNVPRRIFRREKQVITGVFTKCWCYQIEYRAGNVKFTLEKAMKAQRGSRCIAELFFNHTLGVGGWSTPRPGRFTPGKDPAPIV